MNFIELSRGDRSKQSFGKVSLLLVYILAVAGCFENETAGVFETSSPPEGTESIELPGTDSTTTSECTPTCDHLSCDDGCGGQCECPTDLMCNDSLSCVPICTTTCDDVGWECGKICEESCGPCATNEICTDFHCVCVPDCPVGGCGDDGCGVPCGPCAEDEECFEGQCQCAASCDGSHCLDNGCGRQCQCDFGDLCDSRSVCVEALACTETCASLGYECGEVCDLGCGSCAAPQNCNLGQCEPAVSCDECSLRLRVSQKLVLKGVIDWFEVNIEYQPTELEPHPRLFDLRLETEPDLALISAEEGPAMLAAGKQLATSSTTENPWSEPQRGVFRFVALSMDDATIGNGVLVKLRFAPDHCGPLSLRIMRRSGVFAPEQADYGLQATDYSGWLLVTR